MYFAYTLKFGVMKKYLILILCISFFSCKRQPATPEEAEKTLQNRKQEYLAASSEAKIANAKELGDYCFRSKHNNQHP